MALEKETRTRILNLLRGRLVISYLGLFTIWVSPSAAQEVLGIVAVACGVSAVDALGGVVSAYRGTTNRKEWPNGADRSAGDSLLSERDGQ